MQITSSIADSNIASVQYSSSIPSGDYAVTASWVNVPNWSITIPVNGDYILSASTSARVTDTDANGNAELYVRFAVGGVAITGTMRRISHTATSISITLPVEISFAGQFTSGQTITLQAYKPNAGDTCTIGGNTGALGAIPNFSYNLLSTFVSASSIPITNWKPYTMVVRSVGGTNPTLSPTAPVNNAQWRRVGKTMEIQYTYVQPSGGTPGTQEYCFLLPNGHAIDNTILSIGALYSYRGVCGSCMAENAVLGRAIGVCLPYSFAPGDGVVLHVHRLSGSSDYCVSASVYGFDAFSPVTLTFKAAVPVVGW